MTAAYEHNGQPVSSEVFYAIACDPRRNVAVEACAGAGKTWMLVSRIVRALLETKEGAAGSAGAATQPHEILAITFTRRAAGEMRERLYEWLTQFAHADQPTLLRELQLRGVSGLADPQAAARLTGQLATIYRRMLATGRSVQIRTFHGWFAALLRSAPVAVLQAMGLPVNYELLEDDSPAKALVWRRFYELLVKTPWLKADFEAVVMVYGRFQTDRALQAALDKRVEFALADAQGVVDGSVQPFAQQFPMFAGLDQPEDLLRAGPGQQLLAEAARTLGRAGAPSFAARGVELERALSAGDLSAVQTALLTADGKPRKLGEKILGIEKVRAAQELVLAVGAARHQHEAWLYQQRMARLTRGLIAEFTALKRERGWVDMNDVERAALLMLADPVLSGWVQEKLDARIKHLLIDEFQDTNPLQWQALFGWLSSYTGAGQAPSVFMVGDPKQSIYRFRRAEPQVFRAAQHFVQHGLGGDLLSCDHTRRNAPEIIGAVNAAMAAARALDGYEGFREHSTESGDTGRVGRLPPITRPDPAAAGLAGHGLDGGAWRDSLTTPRQLPEDTLRTLEARQAAAWIATSLAATANPRLAPSDVMVLSRKRAGLQPLLEALRALHIPAQIGEKTALIDCCEVLDLVALLDVLVSPQHDLSLARALRSPLFNLGDDALVRLALAQRSLALPWYQLLQQQEGLGLSADGLAGLGAVLARWKGWLDRLPPHDALQAIYDDGDVLARFAAAAPAPQRQAVLANLRALLTACLQLDGGRYATPYALVRALKAGGLQAPATLSSQAVRLLTVHGAKGLEAAAVLLLDTDTAPRNADSMGVLVDWPGEATEPRKFVFLVSESRPPACCAETLQAEQQARRREELNALYVALTRARQTLVISSIEPYRPAPDSWWRRLHDLASELPQPVPPAPAATLAGAADWFNLQELPPATVLPRSPDIEKLAEDSPAARIGKAMHRLLEWGAWGDVQQAAAAREFALAPAQIAEAALIAARVRAGEGAWAWHADALAWQGNEVELAYLGQTLRLDRLVQRQDAGHEGHWWVLDYKSAGAPQRQLALVAQLQDYRKAVQRLYPEAVVKAAFLTGLGTVVELA